MTLEEYGNEIISEINNRRPEIKMKLDNNIVKNNNTVLCGIRFDTGTISPVMYINHYYDSDTDIVDVVDNMLDVYDNRQIEFNDSDIANLTTDYESNKSKIIAKVINRERNKNLLDKSPYAIFGDLAIVFVILVKEESDGIATVMITNEILNSWKVTLSDLIVVAYENMERIFPLNIMDMNDILAKMMENFPSEDRQTLESAGGVMYVLTNKSGRYGAFGITSKKMLLKVAEHINNDKFYIIPSSIHELIICPYQPDTDEEAMLKMVKEVNATQVAPEEILADNLYMFDASIEELREVNGAVIPFVY